MPPSERPFRERVRDLRHLGVGISTEFDAGRTGLDVNALRRDRPDLVSFLEIGIEVDRGVDEDAEAWVRSGAPVTYHFLDLNLEWGDDLDPGDLAAVRDLAARLGAAWVCGDAGLWYLGRRDRGHGVLMPPILCPESAAEMARGIRAVRAAVGLEVLPENPPAHVYLGGLHLLDYYARVVEAADSGMLLDVAHLAVYQIVTGHAPLDGLADFPLDRVVEVHVAGGRRFSEAGRTFVDDDHGTGVLPETWEILDAVLPRARNLRAVVVECERNAAADVVPLFETVRNRWGTAVVAP
jgi:uncharacterized protein (UPF0276 family)